MMRAKVRFVMLAVVAAFLGGVPANTETGVVGDRDIIEGQQRERYFKLVKQFDFSESDQHFESTPMHWRRLTGPGLPFLGSGTFDAEVGHTAPPAFHLSTPLENVAFEYTHDDLGVIPGADYLIVGYVRPGRLEHARAVLEACFVDFLGQPIAASARVSEPIASSGANPEPWRRIELVLPGDFPDAALLRLRAMVLQTRVWRDPPVNAIDPIEQQDVHVGAWFDDISIYRLPRAELRLSKPANLTYVDQPTSLIVEVHNTTPEQLSARLIVESASGQPMHAEEMQVPGDRTVPLEAPLPPLPAGEYVARVELTNAFESLLRRSLRFAVLPELDAANRRHGELGVHLEAGRLHDVDTVRTLVQEAGFGAVRIALPMARFHDDPTLSAYYTELSALMHAFTARRIALSAVVMAPDAKEGELGATSTRRYFAHTPNWREQLAPLLARHVGGMLTTWQLGEESLEDGQPPWDADTLSELAALLSRFVSQPRVLISRSLFEPLDARDRDICWWAPPEIPTAQLGSYLQMFTRRSSATRWLRLTPAAPGGLDYASRVSDLIQRLSIAKALDPDRLILTAPFELSDASGKLDWRPREGYTALRTWMHFTGGARGVGALRFGHGGLGLIFTRPEASCMVVWTQALHAETPTEAVYLGPQPIINDLWGRSWPAELNADGQALIPIQSEPLILSHIDASLALLEASFTMAPTYVQVHDPDPRPVLRFRNHYDEALEGELTLTPPEGWRVDPPVLDVMAAPGELFELPLDLRVPPRQVAATQTLSAELAIRSPRRAVVRFSGDLTVGLKDVQVEVNAFWLDEQTLVVEQTTHNLSDEPLSVRVFCQAPLRPRRQSVLIDIAPEHHRTQTYTFQDASVRELVGMPLHLGLRELYGDRQLDQLVETPR